MRWSRLLSLAAVTLPACLQPAADGPGTDEGALAVEVAPLDLPGVTDVTYRLTVLNGAASPETVWQREVSSTAFGDGAGAVSYVGSCDASANPNRVELELVGLDTVDGTLASGVDFINPAPLGDPIGRTVTCEADGDVSVSFDLTIARRAQQGFFDIAVTFDDVFCSAKLDCSGYNGLLFDPITNTRSRTAVLGLACTAGADSTDTHIYLDDVVIDCENDAGDTTVSVGDGPGNLDPEYGPLPDTTHVLYQAAVFRGSEQLSGYAKSYWNVALGLNEAALPTLGACHLSTQATASATPLDGGVTPDGATWPVIRWDANLTDASGAIVCTEYGLDEGDEVRTDYTTDGPEAFDWAIAFGACLPDGCDALPLSAAAGCLGLSCPEGAYCDASNGSAECVAACGYIGDGGSFESAVLVDEQHTFDLTPVLSLKTSNTDDGEVLGPFASERTSVERTLTGLTPGEWVRVRLRYWALDSWDGEAGQVTVDGAEVWSATHTTGSGCAADGWQSFAGAFPNPWNGDATEEKCYQDVDAIVWNDDATLTLNISAGLDGDLLDESWAVGQVRVDTMAEQAPLLHDEPADYDTAAWTTTPSGRTVGTVPANDSGAPAYGPFGYDPANSTDVTSISLQRPGLGAHDGLFGRVRVWSLDSWDDEMATVSLDGDVRWSLINGGHTCYAGWTSYGGTFTAPYWNLKCYADVVVAIPHTAASATLSVGSTIDQPASDESWAVNDADMGLLDDDVSLIDETGGVDAEAWSPASAADLHTSTGDGLVHGPWGNDLASFAMNFTALGAHEYVQVDFRYWFVDSWDGEVGSLEVDGTSAWSRTFTRYSCNAPLATFAGTFPNPHEGPQTSQVCYEDVSVIIPHTGGELQLAFGGDLDSPTSDESWAVGRVQVTLLNGTMIHDDATNFDTTIWTPTSQVGAPVISTSTGDGDVYGVFAGGVNPGAMDSLSATFTDLPAHERLVVALRYWAIDSWDAGDVASATVDSVEQWSKERSDPRHCNSWSSYTGSFPNPFEGDSADHKCYEDVNLLLNHSANDVTVEVASTITQEIEDETWAVGRLLVATVDSAEATCEGGCHPSCLTCSGPSDRACTACPGGASLDAEGGCHCPAGQLDSDEGPGITCVACDPACTSGCYGTTSDDCLYPVIP